MGCYLPVRLCHKDPARFTDAWLQMTCNAAQCSYTATITDLVGAPGKQHVLDELVAFLLDDDGAVLLQTHGGE
jgi:hypothetical protein